SLLWNTLHGEGKLELEPLIFRSADEKKVVMIVYLGSKLCGHKGIVHGGMLASLLDDTLGRTIIPNLPGSVGFTANLSINYRRPTFADDFVVIKTEVEKVEGRKGFVKGHVEDTKDNVLVDSQALFISPKS
ncbi:Thioesterase/thiol ester dehydrase-isomerase, partial [Basidiobolus meristosporus CBS 931.73]